MNRITLLLSCALLCGGVAALTQCPTETIKGACRVVPSKGPHPVTVCENGKRLMTWKKTDRRSTYKSSGFPSADAKYVCAGFASGAWGAHQAKNNLVGYKAKRPEDAKSSKTGYTPTGHTYGVFWKCQRCTTAPKCPTAAEICAGNAKCRTGCPCPSCAPKCPSIADICSGDAKCKAGCPCPSCATTTTTTTTAKPTVVIIEDAPFATKDEGEAVCFSALGLKIVGSYVGTKAHWGSHAAVVKTFTTKNWLDFKPTTGEVARCEPRDDEEDEEDEDPQVAINTADIAAIKEDVAAIAAEVAAAAEERAAEEEERAADATVISSMQAAIAALTTKIDGLVSRPTVPSTCDNGCSIGGAPKQRCRDHTTWVMENKDTADWLKGITNTKDAVDYVNQQCVDQCACTVYDITGGRRLRSTQTSS